MATKQSTAREIMDTQQKVEIRIPSERDEDGSIIKNIVPVQVNGVAMMIKQGETVEVPVPFYIALKETGRYDI